MTAPLAFLAVLVAGYLVVLLAMVYAPRSVVHGAGR